jgi:RNA polymerase sigma-70 factor (ECF subfamily)
MAPTASTLARRPAREDLDVDPFTAVRPRLVATAHRILGSGSEAEDVVQEAWLRWQAYDRTRVVNPTAFLVTTTTRLALNAAQTARARHETPVGRWLPDPVDGGDDPGAGIERREALTAGIQILCERLTPTERAAYVLRQAFEYPYPRIAGILHTSEANARQLVSRAGRHVAVDGRPPADRGEQDRLVHAFVLASGQGDVAVLERLLTLDGDQVRDRSTHSS